MSSQAKMRRLTLAEEGLKIRRACARTGEELLLACLRLQSQLQLQLQGQQQASAGRSDD